MSWLRRHDAELRHAARVTVAALTAYAVAATLALPQGYWAVFTAVLVTQASVGGSVKAAGDWFVSTLGGGVYAGLVGTLIPKTDPVSVGIGLAVALAPLALLAGLRQTFRFAPVTGGIVILVAPIQHLSPLQSAANRLIEISIGGLIGLAVSLVILPARAHGQIGQAAARILGIFAQIVPLLANPDRVQLQPKLTALHDEVLSGLARLTAAVDEAKHEKSSYLSNQPDPQPVLRTLQRLRADIIMVGRAAAEAFPEPLDARLRPSLAAVMEAFADAFSALGRSLAERTAPPELVAVERAIAAYGREMAAMREAQLTRGYATEVTGRIFAVNFGLEQLRQNLQDLASRAAERARKGKPTAQPSV